MKRMSSWGFAGFLVVAASVGFAVQPWSQGTASPGEGTSNPPVLTTAEAAIPSDFNDACSGVAVVLANFLAIDKSSIGGPNICYTPKLSKSEISYKSGSIATKLGEMKFIVATVPDPVHTHLALTFDRFLESIQQAAQDDAYLFESSWLPWDDDKAAYDRLPDQVAANRRKGERENQPGIILFRRKPNENEKGNERREALVVFVVGEEATSGIHREQFRNASDWVDYLSGDKNSTRSVAILGPSFSGSFSSLSQLLSNSTIRSQLKPRSNSVIPKKLAVYSGTANGGKLVTDFRVLHEASLEFHSFLQNDDVLLKSFIDYIRGRSSADSNARFASLSEDETAFGGGAGDTLNSSLGDETLSLSYPRDISSLRSAYQSKSIFGITSTPSPSESYGKNLPTDLTDSAGKTHDTVQTYAGNQIPRSQEAYLQSIVNRLRESRINYLILRGTNSLDMLFLANFFRRALPDTRIVIDSPDTLFQRERGATSLSGTMNLATYPLFVQEQDWTGDPRNKARRYFKSEFSEGVYIALRLLLNSNSLHPGRDSPTLVGCHVADDNDTFLPAVECEKDASLPDYTPPRWLDSQCRIIDGKCIHSGPVGWLSVIGHNTFWPLAIFSNNPAAKLQEWHRPEVPISITLVLFGVLLLSIFHCWCCFSASFTSKPAFLAHFATIEKSNHDLLIAIGCFSIAAMSLWIGWGSGVIPGSYSPFEVRWPVAIIVIAIWVSSALAYLGNYERNLQLSKFAQSSKPSPKLRKGPFRFWFVTVSKVTRPLFYFLLVTVPKLRKGPFRFWFVTVSKVTRPLFHFLLVTVPKLRNRLFHFFIMSVVFLLVFAVSIEIRLPLENRFLTHWRAVHLGSGVSPLVPALLIVAGIYVWFWYSLHGLALFGKERSLLPGSEDLTIKGPEGGNSTVLRVFSMEDIGDKIEPLAKPLALEVAGVAAGLAVLFFGMSYLIEDSFPFRSLGSNGFSILIDILICACLGLMFAETWQLYRVWGKLHRLLAFLDYIPLRRTLAALHGFSWGRLWKMSGNVLEVRYKLLSRQLESRNHLATSLREKIKKEEKDIPAKWAECFEVLKRCDIFFGAARPAEVVLVATMPHGVKTVSSPARHVLEEQNRMFYSNDPKERASAIAKAIETGENYCAKLPKKEDRDEVTEKLGLSLVSSMAPLREFLGLTDAACAIENLQEYSGVLAAWYAKYYMEPKAGELTAFHDFQVNSAKTAGLILSKVLIPHWRKEGHSLVVVPHDQGKIEESRKAATPSLAAEIYIQNAEEFVSFPFLGFVQNILGRMRTIVMGILALFIAITLAVSSYPFDPRHTISIALAAVFVILGSVITYVYADMHRDSTLSHLTDTTPGELGSEFWFKIVGFGIGPLIGLMAAIFPEIGDFVISWIQPGINSVK